MSLAEDSTTLDHDELCALIESLVREKKWQDLRAAVRRVPVPEIADVFPDLDKHDQVLAFHALPRSIAADVFSYMELEQQNELLANLTDEDTRQLLANLRPDDRTQLLEELPGQVTQRLLNLLSPEDLKEARLLLGYPEESVGRLMTPDYVAVRPTWTAGEAIEHIRKKGRDSEIVSVLYITDKSWKLLDSLSLRRLILAKPEQLVSELITQSFVSISAFADREEAVRLLARYDLIALPVVDSDGILVGIVTVDDVLDVAEEEATEDFQKIGAVSPLKTSYREATVFALFQKRIGWLVILVVVNLLSSGVIAAFEETLTAIIALAFFIPLLIGSGGNAGAQAATLMVRAIATDDVDLTDWLRVVGKEVGVGMLLGAAMGLTSISLGLLRGGVMIGVVVGLSMAAIILVANLIGTILPFILTRLNIDPAVASSPLITTIADATGLLIYFSIATLFWQAGWITV
ncbi:MAG: magnesium transporter [Bradymonadaceae bacterium]|nr:magnesium transporter [Lujinxingiaceae bacterium]